MSTSPCFIFGNVLVSKNYYFKMTKMTCLREIKVIKALQRSLFNNKNLKTK